MGNMSSKNTINDASYQGLKATSGAAHVNVKNTALTIQHFSSGAALTFAATSGVAVIPDLSILGIPFGTISFTKTGNNATATLVYSANSSGVIALQFTKHTTDTIAAVATAADGSAMAGPIPFIDSVGDIVLAIPGGVTAGMYFLYLGRGVVS